MTKDPRMTILAGALASAATLFAAPPLAAQAVVQALPPPALSTLNGALRDLASSPRSVPALLRAAWASLELNDTDAALGFFRRAEAVDPANGEIKAGLATIELRQGDPVIATQLFSEAEAKGVAMARFAADRGLAYDLVGRNIEAQAYYRQALARGTDHETVRRLAISQAMSGDQRASESTLLPLLQRSDLAAYRSRAFALAILGKSEEAVSIAQTMLPGSLSNRMAPYLRYMPRLTRAQQAAAANLGRFPPADRIGQDSPAVAALSAQAAPPVQVAARTPDARLEPAGQPLGTNSAAAARTTERRTRQQTAREAPPARGSQTALRDDDWPRPSRGARATSAPTPAPAPARQAPASTAAPATQQVAAAPAATVAGSSVVVATPAMVRVFESPPAQQSTGAALAQTVAVQNSSPQASVGPAAELPAVGVAQPAAAAASPPAAQQVTVPAITLPPSSAPQQATVVASLPSGQVNSQPPVAAPVTVAAASEPPRPSLSIAAPATIQATPPTSAQVASQGPVPDQKTLADAFADFAQPPAVAPATGAVDISKIEVKREKPPVKEEAKVEKPKVEKPKPPAHPSRMWVQVATGRDVKALGFDWRRISREAGPLLAKRSPHTAKWGQTNRLVVGPYASAAEAQKAVADLKKKDIDSFTFTSDEGEAVTALK